MARFLESGGFRGGVSGMLVVLAVCFNVFDTIVGTTFTFLGPKLIIEDANEMTTDEAGVGAAVTEAAGEVTTEAGTVTEEPKTDTVSTCMKNTKYVTYA